MLCVQLNLIAAIKTKEIQLFCFIVGRLRAFYVECWTSSGTIQGNNLLLADATKFNLYSESLSSTNHRFGSAEDRIVDWFAPIFCCRIRPEQQTCQVKQEYRRRTTRWSLIALLKFYLILTLSYLDSSDLALILR